MSEKTNMHSLISEGRGKTNHISNGNVSTFKAGILFIAISPAPRILPSI